MRTFIEGIYPPTTERIIFYWAKTMLITAWNRLYQVISIFDTWNGLDVQDITQCPDIRLVQMSDRFRFVGHCSFV